MLIQNLIWKLLYKTKMHSIYLESVRAEDEQIDRNFKIVLAIASSGSIAGWAVWQDYSYIWAVVVAISQVLNVIRPIMPYKERMKALSSLAPELRELSIDMEVKWLLIKEGELTDEEMRKFYADMLKKIARAERKYICSITIADNEKLLEKVENKAGNYFSLHFEEEEIYE